MKKIGIEIYCNDCNETTRYEDEYDAPNAGYVSLLWKQGGVP